MAMQHLGHVVGSPAKGPVLPRTTLTTPGHVARNSVQDRQPASWQAERAVSRGPEAEPLAEVRGRAPPHGKFDKVAYLNVPWQNSRNINNTVPENVPTGTARRQ